VCGYAAIPRRFAARLRAFKGLGGALIYGEIPTSKAAIKNEMA